jgi:hypothetical protein
VSAVFPMSLEFYLSGQWRDVTESVLQNPGIKTKHGRSDWGSQQLVPSQASFTMLNTTFREWDPDWPMSPWYGIFGRGTPCRINVRTGRDTFGRVGTAWGVSPDGYAYSEINAGTTSAATTSGAATHTISAAASYHISVMPAFVQRDIDMQISWSLNDADIAGARVEPGCLVWHYTDASNYAFLQCVINTDESIALLLTKRVAGVETVVGLETASGLTHLASHTYTVRVLTEGQSVRAKVWDAATPEPYDWLWVNRLTDAMVDGTGGIGVRTGAPASNTDVPFTVVYTDFVVRHPRFFGEVSTLDQAHNETGKVRTTAVVARGIFARFQAGKKPVDSAMRRYWTTEAAATPWAYWSLEDGKSAIAAESGIGGAPMQSTAGQVKFGSDSAFENSNPLAVSNKTQLIGYVDGAGSGRVQVMFLCHLPASGMNDDDVLLAVYATGSIFLWRLSWRTGGALTLQRYSQGGVLIGTSTIAFDLAREVKLLLNLVAVQNGANVDWTLFGYEVGKPVAGATGGTDAGQTVGSTINARIDPDSELANVGFGHLAVPSTLVDGFAFLSQVNAYNGERGYGRVSRLATARGWNVASFRGHDPANDLWTAYGPQLPKTFAELMEECAAGDKSLIYENRGSIFGTWRVCSSMLHQSPRLTLSYGHSQVGEVILPTADNKDVVNRSTAKQPNGTSVELVQTTGRLAAVDPEDGGIGVIDKQAEVNVYSSKELTDIAAWNLHLGTYAGPRFPSVPVKLHSPELTPVLQLAALDVYLGDLVRLTDIDAADVDGLVVGYSETITQKTHDIVYTTTPGEPWHTAVANAAGHKADSGASTVDTAVSSTATTMSVASVTRWIDSATYASEFPLDITVEGERMTVTAITGTSSPQTFTVTRSVNGIVKAHGVGAAVALTAPVYAAPGVI